MTGSRRVRLRICSCMDARRRFKSSVTTGFTYSVGTVGFATSTIVWEVYFFGSSVATDAPSDPKTAIQTGTTHQYLWITLFTSSMPNSPFRTMHSPVTRRTAARVRSEQAGCHDHLSDA